MSNNNHPKKGAIIKAEPIRSVEPFEAIIACIGNNLRNLAFFSLLVNTNLHYSDLLRLRVGDVRGATSGFSFLLREKKTQKVRKITLNGMGCVVLHEWLAVHPWAEQSDAPLIPNLQTGQALTVSAASRLVMRLCRAVGLKGHHALHILRKNRGYLRRPVFRTDTTSSELSKENMCGKKFDNKDDHEVSRREAVLIQCEIDGYLLDKCYLVDQVDQVILNQVAQRRRSSKRGGEA